MIAALIPLAVGLFLLGLSFYLHVRAWRRMRAEWKKLDEAVERAKMENG